MEVEASFGEARVARDPVQGPSFENELTEYIRATDPESEVSKEWTTQSKRWFLF